MRLLTGLASGFGVPMERRYETSLPDQTQYSRPIDFVYCLGITWNPSDAAAGEAIHPSNRRGSSNNSVNNYKKALNLFVSPGEYAIRCECDIK